MRHGTRSMYLAGCRCEPCKAAQAAYMREKREQRGANLAADDPRHGKKGTYDYYGCRCQACTKANTEAVKERKAKGLPEGDPRHGTRNGYTTWSCRCPACSKAASDYYKEYYARYGRSDRR